MDEEWLAWTRDNLQRNCEPEGVLQILIEAGFSLPAIRRAMGEQFPIGCSALQGIVHTENAPPACLKTIFVQIASYRDEECQWTVKDLFEKAKHPERVNVGVCWQYDPYDDRGCFAFSTRSEQVRIALFHWKASQGLCWARLQAQQLWQGEDYSLTIDSHMRFSQDWDVRSICQLEECPSAKAVLTNYPASYLPPDQLDLQAFPTVLCPAPFNPRGEFQARGVLLDRFPDKPLRGAFVAGGFVFAHSNLLSEVPSDPYMYFSQEEVSLAARFFTHGFDVYSPRDVLAYHFYCRTQGEKKAPLHWSDSRDWERLNQRAAKRLDHLLAHAISEEPAVIRDLDKYGLGTARTLADYEAFCGIDFKRRHLGERALRCEFIEDLCKYKNTPISFHEDSGAPAAEQTVSDGHAP